MLKNNDLGEFFYAYDYLTCFINLKRLTIHDDLLDNNGLSTIASSTLGEQLEELNVSSDVLDAASFTPELINKFKNLKKAYCNGQPIHLSR